jgi:hypothetical protein
MRRITPQAEKHLAAGDRNRELALFTLRDCATWGFDPLPYEWIITMAFYAALHYVDAYLTEHAGGSPSDHTSRDKTMDQVTALRVIAFEYRQLYSRSITARYSPMAAVKRGTVEAVLNDMRYVLAEIRKIL